MAAGAALGVSRAKVFDILEKTGGRSLAYAASANPTTRYIGIAAGNGGLAWWQLLWPQPKVAHADNPSFAWHKPGQEMDVAGTDRTLTVGPDTPWKTLPAQRQLTGFLCGKGEAHVSNVVSSTTLNGQSIHAIATALQAGNPSVIPAISIGDVDYGTAMGAAVPSNVGDGSGIVGLFNSAASRAGGLLADMNDANLYKTQYDAFIQLNRAANRSTTRSSYLTASGAAQFLGTNLAAKLAITDADRARYGLTSGTPNKITSIGEAFIVAVKSFKAGLTNSIVIPAMRDDPHGAFADGSINTVPGQLKSILDGLMNDLANTTDDNTLVNLADDTVICVTGDTPKDALTASAWPDGPAGNANMMYVYSAGLLKTGWWGGVNTDGSVDGYGADGSTTTYNQADTAKYANASVAYAIAKGDERLISPFANGITIGGVFGNIVQS
ncbi:MAG TPA: hypothetical protein VGM88_12425 [Kofleriaceae bacterium]